MNAAKRVFFNPRKGEVLVKNGFSWPAFFFGVLWAIANHMWFPYVLLLLPIDFLVWFLANYAQAQNDATLALLALVTLVAYAVVRGRFGNRWVAASLRRRGYVEREAAANAA
jgi:hypothetical protein